MSLNRGIQNILRPIYNAANLKKHLIQASVSLTGWSESRAKVTDNLLDHYSGATSDRTGAVVSDCGRTRGDSRIADAVADSVGVNPSRRRLPDVVHDEKILRRNVVAWLGDVGVFS